MHPYAYALDALKNHGKKIARAGWNGKGMWLCLVKPLEYAVAIGSFRLDRGAAFIEGEVDAYELLPFIAMKTADNKVVPWLASQTDQLADDWIVIEEKTDAGS